MRYEAVKYIKKGTTTTYKTWFDLNSIGGEVRKQRCLSNPNNIVISQYATNSPRGLQRDN